MIIDESYPEVPFIPAMDIVAASRALPHRTRPDRSERRGDGRLSGALLSDVDFGAFSHSALVRIADEVCLQMHLLVLSFTLAVRARAKGDAALERSIRTKQLIGIAGVAAERIHKALELPGGLEGALRVLELHPLLNPGRVCRRRIRPGHRARAPLARPRDGAWIALCGPSRSARCRPPSRRRPVPGRGDAPARDPTGQRRSSKRTRQQRNRAR